MPGTEDDSREAGVVLQGKPVRVPAKAGMRQLRIGIDIHSIAKGLSLFAMVLKQVGQSFQEANSLHSAEALDDVREITMQSQAVFGEIRAMLDKARQNGGAGNSRRLLEQYARCFKKHRVTYLLAQLESLKLSLMLMLQVLQLGKLVKVNGYDTPDSGLGRHWT